MRSTTEPISPYRVSIVFPADAERRQKTRLEESRFARTAAALAEKGIAVEGAPYVADDVEALREQLMRVDGVLVWINPIVDGRDRTGLNKVLADASPLCPRARFRTRASPLARLSGSPLCIAVNVA